MKNIKKIAKDFYKNLNGELNFQNVRQYCERAEYKVLLFGNNASANSIMNSLGIHVSETKKGILYVNSNHKYIFINDRLDEFARLETLLHEVGHIILKHKVSILRNEVQECEANEFSLCVLKLKESSNYLKSNKAIIILCLATIIIGLSFLYGVKSDTAPETSISEIQIESQPELNTKMTSEIVYVTRSGNCYHNHGCHTIKNSTKFELSITEAKESYRPCKICIK